MEKSIQEISSADIEKHKMDTDVLQEAAVLTPPLALQGGLGAEHRAPNLMQQVFSLFGNVRPGADLTHFQLPPLFNMPKSQLQCYAEDVCCIEVDMLSKCARAKSSLERFFSVVGWSISTRRPAIFGMAPYNPILGETHHVSRGNLNLLLEQVSHHPPVVALHATDDQENIELIWCHYPVAKFYGENIGTSVEVVCHGKRQVKLLRFGENYEMNAPNLLIRLLPVLSFDWSGKVRIQCKESGLEALLHFYKSSSVFGLGGNPRCVKGHIFLANSQTTLFEIEGHWDSIVELKDVQNGETRVLYDAREAILNLRTPIVKDPKALLPTESALVWSKVSREILNKDWEKAREAKTAVEERQRQLQRERKAKGETWVSKHFKVSHTKEGGWECSPIHKSVLPAPIIVPL